MLTKVELLTKYKDQQPKMFGDHQEKCYPVSAVLDMLIIYRNQGIQQASEVCSEMLTDGFRISNIPAVLALKEEI